ncbi:MAG: pyroglutamyl-peptidase I [Firmicutes bacterium]|jgi:pyroglutamyl-peptidase|nr:pyroglutamyl-peptidase I [Bacillota bacterium]
MKILLTGFEPFGGETINPALESVKRLHGLTIAGAQLLAVELPVAWNTAMPQLIAAIDQHQPDAIISIGQAGGRAKITPEYIGINIMNGKDNEGVVKNEEPIAPDGPDGYFATLPVSRMVEAMKAARIPAAISYTAGTYLCNYMAYAVRHHIVSHGLNIKSGFIHIPYLPEQVINKPTNTPSMPLETIVAGLKECIKVIAAE